MSKKEDNKIKILLLDLDGTIIEIKSGDVFPRDAEDWKFRKGILHRIYEYWEKGYKLGMVTNQAGVDDVAQDWMKPEVILDKINYIVRSIQRYIEAESTPQEVVYTDGIIYQIHRSYSYTNVVVVCSLSRYSKYRKPNKEAYNKILERLGLNKKDVEEVIMVGDASGIVKLEELVDKDLKVARSYLEEGVVPILKGKFSKGSDKKTVYNIREGEEIDMVKKYNIKRGEVHSYSETTRHTNGGLRKPYLVKVERIDFSDSDKKFAENIGAKYIDVEDFIKRENSDK